jgi:hypothetical protein
MVRLYHSIAASTAALQKAAMQNQISAITILNAVLSHAQASTNPLIFLIST